MAEGTGEYQVQYFVNVNTETAIANITKFTEAANKLSNIQKKISNVANSFNRIGSAYGKIQSKEVSLTIKTDGALKSLDALSAKLAAIREEANVLMTLTSKGVTRGTGKAGENGFFGYSTPGQAANGLKSFSKEAESASKSMRKIFAPVKTDEATGKAAYAQWGKAARAYENFAKRVKENKLRLDINTKPADEKLSVLISKARELKAILKEPMSMMGPGGAGGSRTNSRTNLSNAERSAAAMGAGMGMSRFSPPKNASYRVLGPSMIDSGGGGAMNFVKGMGIMYGITGLGQLIGGAVNQAVDYDNIMQTVRNILNAHDKSATFDSRFADMTRLVRQVNTETKFTTPQVADATKFLAMAGFNLNQINQSIRPISDIALVGDTDLGNTADVTTNIMTGYKIPASQMRHAADIMTNTFTESNTTLMDVAEAFKYSSSLLKKGGVRFEEAAGAIGILGDAGIKGSHAGTTMRTLMANIVNPTKQQKKAWDEIGVQRFDKQGNMRPLVDIFNDLHERNLPVSYFYRMFRMTAAQGAAALASDVDKWNMIIHDNFLSSGMVKKLADAKKNTIQGLWAQLTSMFAEDGIRSFENIQKPIRDFLNKIINWLKAPQASELLMKIGKDVLDLAKTFWELTESLIKIYGVFRPLLTFWLKAQLYISMILIPLRTFRGLINFGAMIWNQVSSVRELAVSFGLLSSNISGANAKYSLFGKNKTFYTEAVSPVIRGNSASASNFSGNGPLKSYTGGVVAPLGFSQTGRFSNYVGNTRHINSIFSSPQFRSAGSTIGSMVLGGLGGYAGYGLGESMGGTTGGMIGTLVGGGIGMALPYLITAHPIVAGVTAIVASLGYLTTTIYQNKVALDDAKKSNEDWAQSLKNAGTAARDMSQPNATIIANLDIFSNKLSTSNEKMQQSIDLYKRMWAESKAPLPKSDDYDKYVETDEGKQLKSKIEAYNATFALPSQKINSLMPLLQSLGLKSGAGKMYNIGGVKIQEGATKTLAAQALMVQMARDENNPQLMNFKQFMADTILNSKNYRDFYNYLKVAKQRFRIAKFATKWDHADLGDLEDMSLGDIHSSRAYVTQYNQQVDNILRQYRDYGNLLRYRDAHNGKYIPQSMINSFVNNRVGGVLSSGMGAPGSPEFYYHMGRLFKTLPSEMVKDMVQKNMNDLQTVMAQVPSDVGSRMKGMVQIMADILKMNANDINRIVTYANEYMLAAKNDIAALWERITIEWSKLPKGPQTKEEKDAQSKNAAGANLSNPKSAWDPKNPLSWGNVSKWHPLTQQGINKNPKKSGLKPNYVTGGYGKIPSSTESKNDSAGNSNTKHWNAGGNGTDGSDKNGKGGGANASDYSNHYRNNSAAPKQVIVNIGSLMDIKSIDMSKKDNQEVVGRVKEELAQALIDVVHDFDATWNESD